MGVDDSSLGRWAWVYVSRGGKKMQIITTYQPYDTKKQPTMEETVWDQHTRYFEARGEIRYSRSMFKLDLLSLLRRWKASGDKIILMGNFNKNVYMGLLAASLAKDELRLSKMCYRTTRVMLPPTHTPGRIPIDAVFGTAGVSCTAAALLPRQVGVGNHWVFLVDIA